MANLNMIIEAVAGDAFVVRCRVDLAPGQSVTKAWLMAKTNVLDPDDNALISKTVTVVNQSGVGQIEDDGSVSMRALLRFDVSKVDSSKLPGGRQSNLPAGRKTPFAIKVLLSDGNPGTPFGGYIVTTTQVIEASV
jgi:hypothetical protein